LEDTLNIQSRVTLYNYIGEIKNYVSNFDFYLDYMMDIYYDLYTKEYILDLRKKRHHNWVSGIVRFRIQDYLLILTIF